MIRGVWEMLGRGDATWRGKTTEVSLVSEIRSVSGEPDFRPVLALCKPVLTKTACFLPNSIRYCEQLIHHVWKEC
jgi:hypothetical protein